MVDKYFQNKTSEVVKRVDIFTKPNKLKRLNPKEIIQTVGIDTTEDFINLCYLNSDPKIRSFADQFSHILPLDRSQYNTAPKAPSPRRINPLTKKPIVDDTTQALELHQSPYPFVNPLINLSIKLERKLASIPPDPSSASSSDKVEKGRQRPLDYDAFCATKRFKNHCEQTIPCYAIKYLFADNFLEKGTAIQYLDKLNHQRFSIFNKIKENTTRQIKDRVQQATIWYLQHSFNNGILQAPDYNAFQKTDSSITMPDLTKDDIISKISAELKELASHPDTNDKYPAQKDKKVKNISREIIFQNPLKYPLLNQISEFTKKNEPDDEKFLFEEMKRLQGEHPQATQEILFFQALCNIFNISNLTGKKNKDRQYKYIGDLYQTQKIYNQNGQPENKTVNPDDYPFLKNINHHIDQNYLNDGQIYEKLYLLYANYAIYSVNILLKDEHRPQIDNIKFATASNSLDHQGIDGFISIKQETIKEINSKQINAQKHLFETKWLDQDSKCNQIPIELLDYEYQPNKRELSIYYEHPIQITTSRRTELIDTKNKDISKKWGSLATVRNFVDGFLSSHKNPIECYQSLLTTVKNHLNTATSDTGTQQAREIVLKEFIQKTEKLLP